MNFLYVQLSWEILMFVAHDASTGQEIDYEPSHIVNNYVMP